MAYPEIILFYYLWAYPLLAIWMKGLIRWDSTAKEIFEDGGLFEVNEGYYDSTLELFLRLDQHYQWNTGIVIWLVIWWQIALDDCLSWSKL